MERVSVLEDKDCKPCEAGCAAHVWLGRWACLVVKWSVSLVLNTVYHRCIHPVNRFIQKPSLI